VLLPAALTDELMPAPVRMPVLLRLLLLPLAVGARAEEAERVFMFVDPLVVDEGGREAGGGWTVEIAQPVKEAANPLMREGTAASGELWDTHWENTYPTVRYDEHAGSYRMWYNSFLHSTRPKASGGTLYATSQDGLTWTKPLSSTITWNGTSQKTNLVLLADADPNRGVMFDAHEQNASRRYKALGSFWKNLCREKGSGTPKSATGGTAWPPCHNLGVAYSADGLVFDHGKDASAYQPGNQPGLDTVGQNDGALDLALWDANLDGGSYWGLVRIDVDIQCLHNPACPDGLRRTGRFTTKDFEHFSPAKQAFHGRYGYEIYSISPFRLPSWRAGYYMGTASFYNTTDEANEGYVVCELLQTVDWGANWSRVAQEGTEFIPHGPRDPPHGSFSGSRSFDSHTIYTAWAGDGSQLLDPKNDSISLFYYAGGDAPHSSKKYPRNDSIGLARSITHGFAGLRAAAITQQREERSFHPRSQLKTEVINLVDGCSRLSILASIEAEGYIRIAATSLAMEEPKQYPAQVITHSDLQWTELQWSDGNEAEEGAPGSNNVCSFLGSSSVTLEIEATGAVLYALRALGPQDIGVV
jgi:hypothetical protein